MINNLFLVLCLIINTLYTVSVQAEGKRHHSAFQGITFTLLKNWKIKEYGKYIRTSHISGNANCTFSLQLIPGVELLSEAELAEQIKKTKDFNFEELLKAKFRYVKTSNQLTDTIIGGKNAVEVIFEIDPSNRGTQELGACLQPPCGQKVYNITKKIRLISTTTNKGAHSFVCTADYGDFDVTNKAFNAILNSITFER